MSGETDKLVEKVNSLPCVKDACEALTAMKITASNSHPYAKTLVEAVDNLLKVIVEFLSGYKNMADSYAGTARTSLENAEKSYPSLGKPTSEIVESVVADIQKMIPDSVKTSFKTALMSVIQCLLQMVQGAKDQKAGSISELLNSTLMSFNQVKVAVEYASTMATGVSDSVTANPSVTAATEYVLTFVDPETKAKYDGLPDATAKSQFVAEEGWKIATGQIKVLNDAVKAYLPEPLKPGYDAMLVAAEKMTGDMSKKMPSNVNMLSTMNTALTTFGSYLEKLQKWVGTDDSAAL